MRIVEFKAENVKKLKVVEIKPDGSMIVVGGKNAQGKSSVLDAILAALAGKKKLSPKMLREGAKKGFVELDLGDLLVRRTFTESGGGSLKVENNEGATFQSPQKMLDKLVGAISFDPLEFTRLDSKKQVGVLKEITGLDFSDLDAERAELYARRTDVNREGSRLKALAEELEQSLPDDTPEEKVSVADIMKELNEAETLNTGYDSAKRAYDEVANNTKELVEKCNRLKAEFAAAKEELKQVRTRQKKLKESFDKLQRIDTAPIKDRLSSVEENNKKVDANIAYNDCKTDLEKQRDSYKDLTKKINGIDSKKKRLLEESKLPVSGLEFDDGGVILNGLPFEQASGAEQLRVSVAIGLAANPKLKVLLIKDGSLLDEENLKIVGEMAEEAGAQIWLERVGTGEEISVIMEDGEVSK
jgi:DNA repair exonuclease SbcCD ATPase subunit